jgi:hypothetical protein
MLLFLICRIVSKENIFNMSRCHLQIDLIFKVCGTTHSESQYTISFTQQHVIYIYINGDLSTHQDIIVEYSLDPK